MFVTNTNATLVLSVFEVVQIQGSVFGIYPSALEWRSRTDPRYFWGVRRVIGVTLNPRPQVMHPEPYLKQTTLAKP